MQKWSDLWEKPKNLLTAIVVLIVIWGIFHIDDVCHFFDTIFLILANKILPIVIVIAIILYLLKKIK